MRGTDVIGPGGVWTRHPGHVVVDQYEVDSAATIAMTALTPSACTGAATAGGRGAKSVDTRGVPIARKIDPSIMTVVVTAAIVVAVTITIIRIVTMAVTTTGAVIVAVKTGADIIVQGVTTTVAATDALGCSAVVRRRRRRASARSC